LNSDGNLNRQPIDTLYHGYPTQGIPDTRRHPAPIVVHRDVRHYVAVCCADCGAILESLLGMKLELTMIGIGGLLALSALTFALQQINTGSGLADFSFWQWLLQASLLWSCVWYQVWSHRLLNRPAPDQPAFATLGAANRMTIMRGWLIAATGGFLFMPQGPGLAAWAPAILYSIAAILDRLDGFVARRSRQASLLGRHLDGVFDALGLLVAPLVAVAYGKVHWLYLLVSVAYYCFQLGVQWRSWCHKPLRPLLPSKLRRTLAGFQMGMVAVVLWPPFQPEVTVIASIAFMLPMLGGFLVDWLVVSARLDLTRQPASGRLLRLGEMSQRLLQPLLRAITVAVLLLGGWRSGFSPADTTDWIFLSGLTAAMALIVLGLATRIGALALVMLLAWHLPVSLLGFWGCTLICCATLILLLGGGRFSLWQWDDVWVERQDGAT